MNRIWLTIVVVAFLTMTHAMGYESKISQHSFQEDQAISFVNLVKQEVKSQNPWFIIGPRRSQHYLLQVNAAPDVPSFSPLASSEKVFELPAIHSTFGLQSKELAERLAKEALKFAPGQRRTYISLVNSLSQDSREFAEAFDLHARTLGLVKLESVALESATSDMAVIGAMLQGKKPGFILLPNYWDVSYYVISQLAFHPVFKEVLTQSVFLGGDGWGDPVYGLFTNVSIPKGFRAVVVRPIPTADVLLKSNESCGKVSECRNHPKMHAASGTYVVVAERLAEFLCKYRPVNQRDFQAKFSRFGKDVLGKGKSVSVSFVENEKFYYDHDAPVSKR